MSFSNSPGLTDFGSTADFRRDPPAGLRHSGSGPRPSAEQPTGVFVAIEMAVLVLVCAMAMVSVIVSTSGIAPDRGAGVMTEQGMSSGARAGDRPSATAESPAATR